MSIALSMPRALLVGLVLTPLASAAVLEEVTVSATRLRDQAQIDVPASITVLDGQTLTDSAQQHFEEVLAQVPNLNWAAGSSRPRYFQIRGIGEREQYEGAPNSSVGFLIDDIDFSGVGMAATLFDVSQIEVLHGPQGTRLGANALAGLIAVHTTDPENDYNVKLAADLGTYNTRSLGYSATGPVASLDSTWRIAVQDYRSDGFRNNSFLNREDTNDRDELTARGKWRWQPSEHAQLDLTFLHANLANGYDAFSIDNSRVTLSDRPGQDSQRVDAGAAKWRSDFASGLSLTAIATLLDSSSVHAYDGDWGNARSWAPFTYDYAYRAERDRQTQTVEARLASAPLFGEKRFAWLVGAYARRLNEDIGEASWGTFVDPDPISGYAGSTDDVLASRFQSATLAVFTQLDGRLAKRWLWSAGFRAEQYRAEYQDTGVWGGDANRRTDDSQVDTMPGGNVSLTFEASENHRLYAAIYRGYKAGGFNLGAAGTLEPTFDPEFLWNYELGAKANLLDRTLYVDVTLFYMDRTNMQVRTGEQLIVGDPNSFVFVTKNAASGYNYGMESSVRWLALHSLELGASVGLLRTSESGALDDTGAPIPARAQAHAPEYQVQLNATYRQSNFMARIDYAAVDEFYFDVPSDHDQRSQPYALTNLKVGYESSQWGIYAWVRNVFDAAYATRGFYFGNEPPVWENKLYIQNGDPRQYGVGVQWSLR